MDYDHMSENMREMFETIQQSLKIRAKYANCANFELQNPTSRNVKSGSAVVYTGMHSLEEEIRDYIGYYAGPECRALCRLVQKKLPRELRDRIYELILHAGSHSIDDFPSPPDNNWVEEVAGYTSDHICKVQFVGPATLKEIVETWYRVTTFKFDSEDLKNPQIPAFFAHDRCGLDLNIYKLVRNVDLTVTRRLSYDETVQSLILNMKALLPVRSGLQITLRLGFYGGYRVAELQERQIKFANRLAMIFPVLQQQLQAGHQVKMVFNGGDCVFQVRKSELTLEYWLEKLKLFS